MPAFSGPSSFAVGESSHAFGTVLTALVTPYPGGGSGALLYSTPAGKPNWQGNNSRFSRLTSFIYTTSTTPHLVGVMRPLNFATFAAAVAKATTAVGALDKDPGVYSTNYRYPCPGSVPVQVADNALAANDYVVYQLADGTWILDTVASGTFAAVVLTGGTPNRTGATIAAGAPIFFFGIITDVNPATGKAHWQTTSTASTDRINQVNDPAGGGIQTLNRGDPMVLYSPNGTATGTINGAFGLYVPE